MLCPSQCIVSDIRGYIMSIYLITEDVNSDQLVKVVSADFPHGKIRIFPIVTSNYLVGRCFKAIQFLIMVLLTNFCIVPWFLCLPKMDVSLFLISFIFISWNSILKMSSLCPPTHWLIDRSLDLWIFLLFYRLYSYPVVYFFHSSYSRFGHWEDLPNWFQCSFDIAPSFSNKSLLFGTTRCCGLVLYVPCHSPAINTFSKESWLLFIRDQYFELVSGL